MVFTGDCATNYIEVESIALMDGIKICSGSFSYLETHDYEVYIKFVKVSLQKWVNDKTLLFIGHRGLVGHIWKVSVRMNSW